MIIGIILNYAIGDSTDNSGFDTFGWQTSVQTLISIWKNLLVLMMYQNGLMKMEF